MRRTAAYLTIFALMLWVTPVATLANDGGRLEGLIVGVDGRAASGHTVHLINEQGEDAGQAVSDENGVYSFQGVPSGN
ncbi:MAG: carboxypeptidase regulatory-like domain-containing protein, partial [Akkermansiaceae bacterium]|nr:carboxypeptidase regulatory-like domain-containing protein [Akkermansiaceae bacterium]